MVGAERFELPTLWSQTRCATRLRYAPKLCIVTDYGSVAGWKRNVFRDMGVSGGNKRIFSAWLVSWILFELAFIGQANWHSGAFFVAILPLPALSRDSLFYFHSGPYEQSQADAQSHILKGQRLGLENWLQEWNVDNSHLQRKGQSHGAQ